MGRVRVAGVAKQSQGLAKTNVVANFDSNTFRLQMGVEGEEATQIKNDVITADCFAVDRDSFFVRSRVILRYPVFNIDDNSIGDGENFRSVGRPVRVLRWVSAKG